MANAKLLAQKEADSIRLMYWGDAMQSSQQINIDVKNCCSELTQTCAADCGYV